MHKIGEDRSERLNIVPVQLRVIVTARSNYACRICTDRVTQAPAPNHLIRGGVPTEAMFAHVLDSKYADHLPLYRHSQILARACLDLHRAVLTEWVGKAAFHLKPLIDRLAEHLQQSSKLFSEYLADTFTAIVARHKQSQINDLLLWNSVSASYAPWYRGHG